MDDISLVSRASTLTLDGYFSGLKYSPDSTCILTNNIYDNTLHCYEPNSPNSPMSLSPVIKTKSSSPIYNYNWYPLMTSSDPSTCAYLISSRDRPMQLWDAYNGSMRATYDARDDKDEVTSANCCEFSPDGTLIYAGYRNAIRVFRTDRPGLECELRKTVETRKSKDGQKGIVSCIAPNLDGSLYAVGSYEGSIYLYDERCGETAIASAFNPGISTVKGMKVNSRRAMSKGATAFAVSDVEGVAERAKVRWLNRNVGLGITSLKWGVEGELYSASRRGGAVVKWDIRNMGGLNGRFKRDGETNQTLEFDLDPTGRILLVGDKGGKARLYDTRTGEEKKGVSAENEGEEEELDWDAVNGVGFSGIECNGVTGKFAIATGERHYGVEEESSSSSSNGGSSSSSETDDEDMDAEDDDRPRGGKLLVMTFKYSSS